jgi:hypothetical protein
MSRWTMPLACAAAGPRARSIGGGRHPPPPLRWPPALRRPRRNARGERLALEQLLPSPGTRPRHIHAVVEHGDHTRVGEIRLAMCPSRKKRSRAERVAGELRAQSTLMATPPARCDARPHKTSTVIPTRRDAGRSRPPTLSHRSRPTIEGEWPMTRQTVTLEARWAATPLETFAIDGSRRLRFGRGGAAEIAAPARSWPRCAVAADCALRHAQQARPISFLGHCRQRCGTPLHASHPVVQCGQPLGGRRRSPAGSRPRRPA